MLLDLIVFGAPVKIKVLSAPDASKLEFEVRNNKGLRADWLDRRVRNNGKEFHRVRQQVIEELGLENYHDTNTSGIEATT